MRIEGGVEEGGKIIHRVSQIKYYSEAKLSLTFKNALF